MKRFLSILMVMVMLMLTGMEQGAEAYDLKAQEIREVTLFREMGDPDNLNGNANLFWGFQPGSLPEFSGDERYPGDFTDMVLDVGLNPDLAVGPNFEFAGFPEIDIFYYIGMRFQLGRQDMFSPNASDPRLLINDAPPDAQHIVGSVAGIFTGENHNAFDVYVLDLTPWAEWLMEKETWWFTLNLNHPSDAAPIAMDYIELYVEGGVYLDTIPAPEPATILLFGIGLVGLAACARKRQGG